MSERTEPVPAAGELLFLLPHPPRVNSAVFESEGARIVTAGRDGAVRTYECELCGATLSLTRLAEERLGEVGRELTDAERARYLGE